MSLYGELVAPVNSSRAEGEPPSSDVLSNAPKSVAKPAQPQFRPVVRGAVPRAFTKHVAASPPLHTTNNVNFHQSKSSIVQHSGTPQGEQVNVQGEPDNSTLRVPSGRQLQGEQQGEPDPEHELIDALAQPHPLPFIPSSVAVELNLEHEIINLSQSDSSVSTPGSTGPGAPPPDFELINAKEEIEDFYDPRQPNLYIEKVVVAHPRQSQQHQNKQSYPTTTTQRASTNSRDAVPVNSPVAPRKRKSPEIVIDDCEPIPVQSSDRALHVPSARAERSVDHAHREVAPRAREHTREREYNRNPAPERRSIIQHDRPVDVSSNVSNHRDRPGFHAMYTDDRSRLESNRRVEDVSPRNADHYDRYSSRGNSGREQRDSHDGRSSSRVDVSYDSRRMDEAYPRGSRTGDVQNEPPSLPPNRDRPRADPSRLIILSNLCDRGSINPELEHRVKQECSRYGKVKECRASSREGSSTMYIKFMSLDDAIEAQKILDGKYFAVSARSVRCDFGMD